MTDKDLLFKEYERGLLHGRSELSAVRAHNRMLRDIIMKQRDEVRCHRRKVAELEKRIEELEAEISLRASQ